MTERRLRRQRLVFYLSRKIETSSKGIKSAAALSEYYNQLLGQFRSEFEHTHEMLTEIFAGQGARIIPMKDADHFRHYKTFLNPSLAERFDYDPIDGFDPQLSIQENCWHSEGSGTGRFRFLHGWPLSFHHRAVALAEDDLSRNHPPAHQPASARLHHHGESRPAFRPQGNQQGGKGTRPHCRRLCQREKTFAVDGDGQEAKENRRAHAGAYDSVQSAVCHPHLGQKQGRADCQNDRHQERHQFA